ncbi:MAG TPA: hypothetical protein VJY39_04135 [Acidisphaera sp.]|nr:hypothetical protein [Acidisphaera sp.]
MEHYLLHLSYTSSGWKDIIDKSATFDQRLESVRKLIAHLGGSFASFHFYDTPHFHDPAKKHVVTDKFAMFGGHDLMAVLAMPTKQAAQAFTIALEAQPGIESIDLVSMMPFEEAITAAVAAGKAAVAATGYTGRGPAVP